MDLFCEPEELICANLPKIISAPSAVKKRASSEGSESVRK